MRKKLVWVVAIVLILSIVSTENVLGWPYFIEQAWDTNRIKLEWDGRIVNPTEINIICSTSSTSKPSLKILATQGGTRGPYFSSGGYDGGCRYTPKYTDGGIPVSSSDFITSYGSVELRKNGYTTNPVCVSTTNIRIGTNQDGGQDINAMATFGGYIYVTKKLPTLFELSSQSESHADWSENRDVDISSYLNIYNVNQKTPATSALGTSVDLDSGNAWDYLFANSEGKNSYCSDFGTTYLEPGIYYIMLHAGFDNSYDNNNDWGIINLHYGANSLTNSDFTIFSDPLTKNQIIAKYTDTEIDTAFCEAADGNKNLGVSAHFGCCREKWNGEISNGFLCSNKDGGGYVWSIPTPEEYCSYLSGTNTYAFNPRVLSMYSSTNSLQYMKDTKSGADGCCGDDGLGDYSFVSDISGRKQYLCHDYSLPKTAANNPIDNSWINAMISSYKIVTTTNKATVDIFGTPYTFKGNNYSDLISNSQDWFVCNADGKVVSNAIKVAEGKTFTERFTTDQYSCAAMMSAVYDQPFEEACYYDESRTSPITDASGGPFVANCCKNLNGDVQTASNIGNCQDCYLAGIDIKINSQEIAQNIDDVDVISTDTSGAVDKELCVNDPESCLIGTINYNKDKLCIDQQVTLKTELCNVDTSYCTGGTLLPTYETKTNSKSQCCIGSEAKCKAKTEIIDAQTCSDSGGFLYPTDSQGCTGVDAPLGGGLGCCFGSVYVDYAISDTYNQADSSSFICFKNNGNNVFSQCCYDSTCANADYVPSSKPEIVQYNDRVLSKGSSIHTLENYDVVDTTDILLIKDRAWKFNIRGPGTKTSAQGEQSFGNLTSINGFSYLEFDVLTDSETMNVIINQGATVTGYDAGRLYDYSVNGDKSNIWHHISIPTSQLAASGIKNIKSIKFYDTTSGQHYVIIDNIVLVPTDTTINTQPYYCTGGFEGWINDLDAPEGSTLFSQYGPYMFACSGIASYTWTGTRCCGDDTKINNNGEYYSDTQYGCFDGTKVADDQTVPESKNYYSSSSLNKDDITIAPYNDLLYYDGEYMTCQTPNTKYLNILFESIDGSTPRGALLDSTNNIPTQCGMIGKHYCMNGIWRTKILLADGTEKSASDFNEKIVLKTTPPETELVQNGFRN